MHPEIVITLAETRIADLRRAAEQQALIREAGPRRHFRTRVRAALHRPGRPRRARDQPVPAPECCSS